MRITVEDKDVGDARRGFHNTDTTITFEHRGSNLTPEREREICDAIIGSFHMWKTERFRVAAGDIVIYTINHGYDSGD